MFLKSYWLILALSCIPFFVFAGGENHPAGARSAGLSYTSILLQDHWATFNNQAGLSGIDGIAIGLFGERKFGLKELNAGAITMAYGTKDMGTFALNMHQFSNSTIYQQQKYGLAYARSFGDHVSAGIQFDVFRTNIQEYGSQTSITGEAGLLFHFTDQFHGGVHVFNPTAEEFSDNLEEPLPTIYRIGLGYEFSDQVMWAIEAVKATDHKTRFKSGLEYAPNKTVTLRAGIMTQPVSSSFGLGIFLKDFRINMAFSFHQMLGFTPYLDLNYVRETSNQ